MTQQVLGPDVPVEKVLSVFGFDGTLTRRERHCSQRAASGEQT